MSTLIVYYPQVRGKTKRIARKIDSRIEKL